MLLLPQSRTQKSTATILTVLAKINGTDAPAMARAQRLFNQLIGTRGTESLVRLLQVFLDARGWGVFCPKCDKPSRVVWKPNKKLREKGLLTIKHPDKGEEAIGHKSFTKIPGLTLIVLPLPKRYSEKLPSEHAQDVMDALSKIGGRDVAAMAMAQDLFDQLIGERCTKELVQFLIKFLRTRGWGITCLTCGKPAAPCWIPTHCRAGGLMRLRHGGAPGTQVAHKAAAKMPKLKIVFRPRRRPFRPPI